MNWFTEELEQDEIYGWWEPEFEFELEIEIDELDFDCCSIWICLKCGNGLTNCVC
jgi:hypothetical protein